jgi:V-type H+-transporting ATPase subunit C
MSKPTRWLIVSLPTSISQSNDREEAFGALQACISQGDGAVVPFAIPEFKIGTLDNLVLQAEELSKLEGTCQAVTHKVADTLQSVLDGDEDKIAQQKTVNDSRSLQPTLWPRADAFQSPWQPISTHGAGIRRDTGKTGRSGTT